MVPSLSPSQCPYTLQTSNQLLCALWNEIQLANTTSLGSTASPDLNSLLGNATGGNGEISYSDCPYLSDDNSFTACHLWCELRELSRTETCSGAPVCPYENYTEPYNQLLCNLWLELQGLEATSQTTQSSSPSPASSPVSNSQSLSTPSSLSTGMSSITSGKLSEKYHCIYKYTCLRIQKSRGNRTKCRSSFSFSFLFSQREKNKKFRNFHTWG